MCFYQVYPLKNSEIIHEFKTSEVRKKWSQRQRGPRKFVEVSGYKQQETGIGLCNEDKWVLNELTRPPKYIGQPTACILS